MQFFVSITLSVTLSITDVAHGTRFLTVMCHCHYSPDMWCAKRTHVKIVEKPLLIYWNVKKFSF